MIGYDGDLRVSAELDGVSVIGYIAESVADSECPYLGSDVTVDRKGLGRTPLLVAMDVPRTRARIAQDYGDLELGGYVSKSAVVATSARIDPTAIIQMNCLVSERAVLGPNTKVNIGARLHHHATVGANSVIAPGAVLLGHVKVGEGCYVGAGALIRQGLTIGDGALIGMGAVVVSNIPPRVVAYGNPARIKSELPS